MTSIVLAGNRRTVTWTITLEDGSPALSTADIAVLRKDSTGTTELDPGDVTVTDTATGGIVAAVVRFDDTLPRSTVTLRLDIDDADGPVYADEAKFDVQVASAQRPAP